MTSVLSTKQRVTKVQQYDRLLTIQWSDASESSFHYFWLRDNCRASWCKVSGQREVDPRLIPMDVTPNRVTINDRGQLEILWRHDNHLSTFELDWLRQHSYSNGEGYSRGQRVLWDSTFDPEKGAIDYQQLQDNGALRNWLRGFQTYGVAKIHNVPEAPQQVVEIAKRISYIWGSCHDISYTLDGSTAESDYVANTHKFIGLHTDDPYFNPSPPVQVLHCLRNATSGGERLLADGFNVAEVLREQYPEYFRLLSQTPIKFRWKDYEDLVPVIQLDWRGELEQIRFSNQSFQPLRLSMEITEAYYEAYRCFSELLVSDRFQIQYKYKPGELNIIDNYRILHGRTEFSADGSRHFVGCYIGRDALYSHLTVDLAIAN